VAAAERAGREICEWLWYPLAIAALNQSPDEAAALPFVNVLAGLFGSDPRDSAIGCRPRPLNLMYAEPARAFIEARRGSVRTGALASITIDGARVREVEVGRERFLAPVVIAAVPWFASRRSWSGARRCRPSSSRRSIGPRGCRRCPS